MWERDDVRRDRPEERWAQATLQVALKEAVVEQYDDGSRPGMHDLRIRYPDGRTGAAEVTRGVHSDATALWRIIGNPGRWIDPSIRGGWAVSVRPAARGKLLRNHLPALLRDLEADGITGADDSGSDQISRALRRLGIEDVHQSGTDFPGSIYPVMSLPSDQTGGWVPVTGEPLAVWLREWILAPRRSDNLAKLWHSGAEERHLFIVVDGFGDVPFEVTDLLIRDDAPLPGAELVLPPELTHVWVMSTWDSGHGVRWSSVEHSWASFAKVTPPLNGLD